MCFYLNWHYYTVCYSMDSKSVVLSYDVPVRFQWISFMVEFQLLCLHKCSSVMQTLLNICILYMLKTWNCLKKRKTHRLIPNAYINFSPKAKHKLYFAFTVALFPCWHYRYFQAAAWSCSWDLNNSHYVYVGLQVWFLRFINHNNPTIC